MKSLLNKAKSKIDSSSSNHNSHSAPSSTSSNSAPQADQENTIKPPTAVDVLRYRYHHGTNLGSIFVLEKWLHPSMFPSSSPNGSELSAVSSSLSSSDLHTTRAKWEAHWSSALSDADWHFLVHNARCTSIRLPIGYFTLGPQFCQGTPFEKVAPVYANAWNAVKEFVRTARRWGVGVLLDLHAVPGGANGDAHSGCGTNKAELWTSRSNKELTRKCLSFIATQMRDEGLIGIQVVNEAQWEAKGMWDFYDECVAAIAAADPEVPIYISDAWNTGKAVQWLGNRNRLVDVHGHGNKQEKNPVIVDVHRYYTFSDADRKSTPQENIQKAGSTLLDVHKSSGNVVSHGAVQAIVGEWSCVMDGASWGRVSKEQKPELVKQFGHTQCRTWEERSGGHYFWTAKMQWMDGGEWGFFEQTKKGNVLAPTYMSLSSTEILNRAQHASTQRDEAGNAAKKSHAEYWDRTQPGKKFQHELYSEGWDVGFSDALKFFTMRAEGGMGDGGKKGKEEGGADRVGCREVWVRKRLVESGRRGESVWEWEQGVRAGMKAFETCVGI